MNCTEESKTWTKIYENDENGSALNDMNITALADAIKSGAEVKVYTPQFGLVTVQKATVHINEDGKLVKIFMVDSKTVL